MTDKPCRHGRILVLVLVLVLALAACRSTDRPEMLRIGLAEEPRTLNIWMASDANSRKVISLIYQSLYVYDPATLDLVPWLAAAMPIYDPEHLTYTVHLRNARWSDGTPFTARDVIFTGNLIQSFTVPRFAASWRFIKHIEATSDHTVTFYLKQPMATFLTGTLITPIVQEKEWSAIAEKAKASAKPLTALLNHRIQQPVGTGPFILKQWRQGAFVHLQRNPYFFGTGQTINGRVLGPFFNDLVYRLYGNSDVAILDLKKGGVDMLWFSIQPGYIADLVRYPRIRLFTNERNALYFMGFNLRRPPFDDIALRRAVAYLIDKDFIISRIQQTQGQKMFSVVPAKNHFWYCPDLPRHGDGMSRAERLKTAQRLLADAGYSWTLPPVDEAGNLQTARALHLPDGNPMGRVTILTPPADYDPHRAISGLMIQEWLRELGMPVYARPMAFSALLQQVKDNHDFDAFILGYGRLRQDPEYIRNFFHSTNDAPRGWNMSGYRNPDFDQLADRSIAEMDVAERQTLVFAMQQLVARDLPFVPLYNPSVVEAVRTDRFDGWVEMLEGIGNIWSMCQVKPVNRNGS